jgi:hypothetical protein
MIKKLLLAGIFHVVAPTFSRQDKLYTVNYRSTLFKLIDRVA